MMGFARFKKGYITPGVFIFFSILLTGSCVTTKQDLLYLNDQIVALNSRVNTLQKTMDSTLSGGLDSRIDARVDSKLGPGLQGELEPIRSSQAGLVADMEKLKGDIQTLSGRVEEGDHLIRRAVERDTTEQDAMKANLTQLMERVAELEKRVDHLHRYLSLESSLEKKGGDEKAPPSVAEKAPPAAPKPQVLSEAETYDEILSMYREGRYEEAITGFKRFLKEYAKSDLADNAQFWVGECYMALNQYEQAILAYQEVIKNYPNGNKVPNAMLRQALAFLSINDKKSAELLLKRIVKRYPKSSEAKIAEAKLKKLD